MYNSALTTRQPRQGLLGFDHLGLYLLGDVGIVEDVLDPVTQDGYRRQQFVRYIGDEFHSVRERLPALSASSRRSDGRGS